MIFIDMKVKYEENNDKKYEIKYATFDDLYVFMQTENQQIKYRQIELSISKTGQQGLIDNDNNIFEYKQLFYEVAETRVIVSNRETGNLLLDLSHEAPKKLPINKVLVYSDILETLSNMISNNDITIDVNNLKDNLKKVEQIDDNFEKMVTAYKYNLHTYVSYTYNSLAINKSKQEMISMFDSLLSNSILDINKVTLDRCLNILDKTKADFNNLLEQKFSDLNEYEYDFTYLNSEIFTSDKTYYYTPF